jgi:hypothetical protein
MQAKSWYTSFGWVVLAVLMVSVFVAGCGSQPLAQPLVTATSTGPAMATSSSTRVLPTARSATLTAMSVETFWKDLSSADFNALHSPVSLPDTF